LEEKTIRQTNYTYGKDFEDRINSFFRDIGLAPLHVAITILENADYDRHIDKDTMASLHISELEQKDTALTKPSERTYSTAPHTINKVYIRESNGSIDLTDTVAAFLQAHFPNRRKDSIENAKETFATAFKCYDQLFKDKNLKDFFTRICKQEASLFKMAKLQPV
jgi:hypothetical protein